MASPQSLIASIPVGAFGGGTGLAVPASSPYAVLSIPAAYAAARITSEIPASLSVRVVRRDATGTHAVPGHRAATFLNGEAAPGVLSEGVRETWALHAFATGNGYLRVWRDDAGGVIRARNLDPAKVKPFVSEDTGEKFFEVARAEGEPLYLDAADIAHLYTTSYNGFSGIDHAALLAPVYSTALLIDTYVQSFLRKGPFGGGYIKFPAGTKQADIDASRKGWRDLAGVGNAGDTPYLVGAEYAQVTPQLSPQVLELRTKFINDIANIARVSPTLLYQFEAAGKAAPVQVTAELIASLRPHIERQEAELSRVLLTAAERAAGLAVEIDTNELLRLDPLARSQYVIPLVNSGILSPNGGADEMGLPPIPGGDVPRIPVAVSQPADVAKENNKADPATGTETGGTGGVTT